MQCGQWITLNDSSLLGHKQGMGTPWAVAWEDDLLFLEPPLTCFVSASISLFSQKHFTEMEVVFVPDSIPIPCKRTPLPPCLQVHKHVFVPHQQCLQLSVAPHQAVVQCRLATVATWFAPFPLFFFLSCANAVNSSPSTFKPFPAE